MHHRHPRGRFLICRPRTAAAFHGIFALQEVNTGTFIPFFSGKLIKTEQIRDFPKSAVADGRMTRGKVHHVHKVETFRTSLQLGKRKKLPDPEKGMDSLKQVSENI